MEKKQIRGLAALGIGFATYSLVVFLVPFPKKGVFWLSYLFSLVALAFQIPVAASYIKSNGARSRFYGLPLIRLGFLYLGVQWAVSLVFMALGSIAPVWLVVLVDLLLLAAASLGLIAADAVREEIQRQDVVLENRVQTMRTLQSKVSTLTSPDPRVNEALQRLKEDLRYSDPVSSPELDEAEDNLAACLDELQFTIAREDSEKALFLCQKSCTVLAERNRLCKLYKH